MSDKVGPCERGKRGKSYCLALFRYLLQGPAPVMLPSLRPPGSAPGLWAQIQIATPEGEPGRTVSISAAAEQIKGFKRFKFRDELTLVLAVSPYRLLGRCSGDLCGSCPNCLGPRDPLASALVRRIGWVPVGPGQAPRSTPCWEPYVRCRVEPGRRKCACGVGGAELSSPVLSTLLKILS